jgi:hypothetical protein
MTDELPPHRVLACVPTPAVTTYTETPAAPEAEGKTPRKKPEDKE